MKSVMPSLKNTHIHYALITLPSLLIILFFAPGCKKSDDLITISQSVSANAASNLSLKTRPNIVFILGDDIGRDIPTSFGGESYQTANLDMMAQRGMKFTEVHSSPLCSPSRVCLMTGKYNFRNYTVWGVLDPAQKTIGNIMKSAGYATFVAGKWQLDGGDIAVHGFGFDNYSLWNPIKDDKAGEHYKDPHIYEYGAYLPDSYTNGKYGDDIFTDRILAFIDSNRTRNFFVYYPITLCHYPYAPTPEDPEFAAWDTKLRHSDTSFFPSMVKYMDEKVGLIINRLKRDAVLNNTLVIFVGDNGTPQDIYSWWNGNLVQGGKSEWNEAGTNVPMFAIWPDGIAPGQVNDNLIDFSDFLPTFAELSRVPVTSDYGTIDGQSFARQMAGLNYTPRSWIFNHYQPNTNNGNDILVRWIQDKTYKLYDSTYKFYNIAVDPDEKHPLKNTELSPEEKATKQQFRQIMSTMHN